MTRGMERNFPRTDIQANNTPGEQWVRQPPQNPIVNINRSAGKEMGQQVSPGFQYYRQMRNNNNSNNQRLFSLCKPWAYLA